VPQVGVSDQERFEDLRQARFIAPGSVPAVRDAADINDVVNLVLLEECEKPHKIEVAVPNRKDRLRHTLLYTIDNPKINNYF
jgi:hypothetical protein